MHCEEKIIFNTITALHCAGSYKKTVLPIAIQVLTGVEKENYKKPIGKITNLVLRLLAATGGIRRFIKFHSQMQFRIGNDIPIVG